MKKFSSFRDLFEVLWAHVHQLTSGFHMLKGISARLNFDTKQQARAYNKEGIDIFVKKHKLGGVANDGGQCSIDSIGTQTFQNYSTQLLTFYKYKVYSIIMIPKLLDKPTYYSIVSTSVDLYLLIYPEQFLLYFLTCKY